MRVPRIFFFLLVSFGCDGQSQKHDKIVLFNVGNADRIGIAEVVDRINEIGNPKVIAIDLQFSVDKDSATDNRLIRSLARCSNLVLISVIDDYFGQRINYDRFIPGSMDKFKTNATTGFGNVTPEEDGVLKNFSQWEYVNGAIERSFALEAVYQYDSLQAKKFLMFNKKNCSVDFSNGYRSFITFDGRDVLSGTVQRKDIDDKIVMIGFLGPGTEDKFISPMAKHDDEPDMYGLEFQAAIVAQVFAYK